MHQRLSLTTLAALAIAALLMLPGTGTAGGTTVKLGDDFFKPDSKTVSKGTKVRFKWIGDNAHNVTKTKGPGKNFASETTSSDGVHYVRKFKKSGKYKLVCTIHSGMDMVLKVK